MTTAGKRIPRTADLQFSWLTRQHGPQWQDWSTYAAEWIALQGQGLDARLHALRTLFEKYLIKLGLPAAPSWFLSRAEVVPDLYEVACPKSMEESSTTIAFGNSCSGSWSTISVKWMSMADP
jgi:hypothetical protein